MRHPHGTDHPKHLPVVVALAAVLAAPGCKLEPAVIHVYHGFGTTARARIWGRVLEDEGDREPPPKESGYKKLKRVFYSLESDEIPNARVTVKVLGKKYPARTDKEGLFTVTVPGPLPPGRHPVDVVLHGRRKYRVEKGFLHVWPAKPGVAVVSDIDDTVLRTGVGNKLKMAWKIARTNSRDLRTYPYAAALYRAFDRRGYPLAFVSGSPINFYLRLKRFFRYQRFPTAPMLLKDFGLFSKQGLSSGQLRYKLDHFQTVLALLPGYRFILVGDSGEQDPEVYAAIKKKLGSRVLAILIHLVSKHKATDKRFAGQLVFRSYLEAARQLAKLGLLQPADLQRIESAQKPRPVRPRPRP